MSSCGLSGEYRSGNGLASRQAYDSFPVFDVKAEYVLNAGFVWPELWK